MSSSVESRIVTMKFDNSTFQRGVSTTLTALDKLKIALSGFTGSSKGLNDVNAAAGKFSMGNVTSEVEQASSHFSALSVIAVTALATIAHAAVNTGIGIGKSLTLDPISQGLSEYETNLNSIQTIMANTGLEGDKGLAKVNAALDELNHYSDKTIYNFSEMARNIGTFTAAGVELQPATEAIKGIANLAALSGSNSQQASTAMYQLSQALAAGKVSLMDWNSVVNAGMGGEVFQEALAETARVHGVAVDDIIEQAGSFRASISEGWITSDIMTETLAKFTGDLSRAQLQNMGYTEEQIEGIIKMGQTATDAATKVKTASALINTLQETATSGWAKSWQLLLGDFNQAKETWTQANDVLGGMLSESAKQRNKVLREWNALGGRDVAIEAISNAFKALLKIIGPVTRAWRDVFPAMTGQRLFEITEAIGDFTRYIKANKGTMHDLRTIFGAIFGVLAVGWEVVKGVLRYFFDLIGLLASGTGGLLDFSGSIAEVISQLTDWILKGDYIANFFDKIIAGRAALLSPIIDRFSDLLTTLAGFVGTGADTALNAIGDALAFIEPYLPVVEDAMREVGTAVQTYLIENFERLQPVLESARQAIYDALTYLSGMGGTMGSIFGGLTSMFDIGDAADTAAAGIDKVQGALGGASSAAAGGLQTGLSAFGEWLSGFGDFLMKIGGAIAMGIGWLGKQLFAEIGGLVSGGGTFLGAIGELISNIFGGIVDAISDVSFGDIMIAMHTLLMGGLGVAIMRFIWQLGDIFKDMRGMFQGVGGVLDQVTDNLKTMQTDVRSNIILKIAIALGILAASIYILSEIDAAKLAKGLGAIATMLIMLVVAIKVLEKSIPDTASIQSAMQLGAMSAVLLGLGLALLALAIALRVISNLDGGEIAKGLATLGAALAGIVAATVALNRSGGAMSILQASIAIGILAFALTALAGAIKLYSMLDQGMLAEGGLKIALMIAGLGLAFRAFPASGAVASAAAMFIIANALVVMAGALKLIATMDAGDSWQSLITLGVALGIIAAAANLMNGAMMGAGAMAVMAASLALLIPQLILLGGLSWEAILKGLVALAGVFVVVGLAGLVLTPIIPMILALAIAIGLLGISLMLIGGAMALFGIGLTAIASSGAAASAILVSVINDFLESSEEMARNFQKASVAWANAIAAAAPAWMKAGTAIIMSFLRSVIKVTPQLGKTLRVMIVEALTVLMAVTPMFIVAGLKVIKEFLKGVDQNMPELVERGVNIVVKLLDGIAKRADDLVGAARRLIEAFGRAIVSELRDIGDDLTNGMAGLAWDMIDGMIEGLRNGAEYVMREVANLANAIPGPIRDLLGIRSPSTVMRDIGGNVTEGLALGIGDKTGEVETQARKAGKTALDTLKATMSNVSDAISSDVDLSPTITPVLDLTRMQNEASKISGLMETEKIAANVSYAGAAAISADELDSRGDDDDPKGGGVKEIKFEQNNYSPKALTAAEIWRNTRSQVAQAKEVLEKDEIH